MINLFKRKIEEAKFNSANYWEQRYSTGGNSGDGSYGRLADFKADFLNDFVKKNNVDSIIEFGCGDGNQLSLAVYPKYLGLDVSQSIIKQCGARFKDDYSKSFFLYDGNTFFNHGFLKADLALSLDVIYHIVEEPLYLKYLRDLFSVASTYVIIYSTNYYKNETTHVVHREFLKDVKKFFPDFSLILQVENEYPGTGDQESEAKFFVFKNKLN